MCAEAASGELDLTNPLIKHDLATPDQPRSAIGYIVEALRMRRQRGLPPFTVMSCDNLRENGHVARVAVLGLAWARDAGLADWIANKVTFPARWLTALFPPRPRKC